MGDEHGKNDDGDWDGGSGTGDQGDEHREDEE
jgi:hypothetical protein